MTDTRQERRHATVSENGFAFTALLKPDGEILDIDRQALAFWGLNRSEVEGRNICDIGWQLLHDEDAGRLRAAVAAAAAGQVLRREAAVWNTAQQATPIVFSLRPITDRDNRVVLLVAHVQSPNRQSPAGSKLHPPPQPTLAGFAAAADSPAAVPDDSRDPLTGLPTRAALIALLDQLLAGERQGSHTLCYLDLDSFQQLAADYGRDAAESALLSVAQELDAHARRGDVLARVDDDAFGLLLRDCTLENARPVADALLRTVQQTRLVDAGGPGPELSASIGLVALDDVPGGKAALQRGRQACLDAKEAGGNRVEIADSAQDSQRVRRPPLRTSRLRLLAQPAVPLTAAQRPAYAEILLRVVDQAGQLTSPEALLATVGHTELGSRLDRWVISKVVAHAAGEPADDSPAGYSINLSAQSVLDPELPSFVLEQCRQHGVAPKRLAFELHEALLRDDPQARLQAEALRAAGFAVILDDCGINHLDVLPSLPADQFKINGALIQALADAPINSVLIDAVNRIAHLSGKQTIAKWVEDDAQLARVRELQLDYAQGYALAQPARL